MARVATSWALLLLSANLARVLAATAGWAPPRALAESVVGVGVVGALGALVAAVGLIACLLRRPGAGLFRFLTLSLLMAAGLITMIVFTPRWVCGLLQTERTIFFVPTDQPVFALTVDDGLDPSTTPAILEVLAEHNVTATFFVLGESLRDDPELAERCVAEGHELANHQMTDSAAVSLEPDVLERQVREADALLRQRGASRWFRPGGGIVTSRCREIAGELGYTIALGSVFPFDSHMESTRFITAYLAGRTRQGDIVVLHDGGERGERTAVALGRVLPELAKRGLRAVTLSELADLARL